MVDSERSKLFICLGKVNKQVHQSAYHDTPRVLSVRGIARSFLSADI